jgi:hypothetical protein
MPNRRRPGLGLLLLVGLLATFGSATFGLPDSAFTPSYFDGQDGDGALWAVLEGIPALLAVSTAVAVPRILAAATLLLTASARSLASPRAARLRAPPLG